MRSVVLFILICFLSACSDINSLHPFDRAQAAKLLQQHGKAKNARYQFVIALPSHTKWQHSYYFYNGYGAFTLLIPKNETVANFSESIQGRMMPVDSMPNTTNANYVNSDILFAKKHCKEATITILKSNYIETIYQIHASQCEEAANLFVVTRVNEKSDGLYVLRYLSYSQPSAIEKDQMKKVIFTASVNPY